VFVCWDTIVCATKNKEGIAKKKIHVKKVIVVLKRRKQVENLAVFVELKRKLPSIFYILQSSNFLEVIQDKKIHLDD
jgi:hypothetical protein